MAAAMIRRLHSVIIIAAMATLALMNASCQGTLSPSAALAASGDQFAELTSFQARIETTARAGEFTFSSEGSAAYRGRDLVYLRSVATSEGRTGAGKVETLLVPPDFYAQMPDGQWYVLSPWHQGTRPNEIPDLSFDEEFLNYREILSDLSGVEQLSDETIDGETYMRFAGDVAFSDIDRAPETLGTTEGAFHVDLWVHSSTQLPYRMLISAELRGDGDEVLIENNLTFQYNQPITIPELPTQTRPWRDLEFPEAPCTGSKFEGCLGAQAGLEPIAKPSCDGLGRRICLAPLGQIDASLVEQLVEYYRAQYGLDVAVLTPLAVPAQAADPKRQQADAATLIINFGVVFPEAYADPEAVLIGVTPLDLYDSTSHFRYVFGLKGDTRDPKGIVSTFRMTPEFYGSPADPDLLFSRSRKLLTKYIGLLYYDLPPSDDPASPMYNKILGPADLDAMGEPLSVPEVQ